MKQSERPMCRNGLAGWIPVFSAFSPTNPIFIIERGLPFFFILSCKRRTIRPIYLRQAHKHFCKLRLKCSQFLRNEQKPTLHGSQESRLEAHPVLTQRRLLTVCLRYAGEFLMSPHNSCHGARAEWSERLRFLRNLLELVQFSKAIQKYQNIHASPVSDSLGFLLFKSAICCPPNEPYRVTVVLNVLSNQQPHFVSLAVSDFLRCSNLAIYRQPSDKGGKDRHSGADDAATKAKPVRGIAGSPGVNRKGDPERQREKRGENANKKRQNSYARISHCFRHKSSLPRQFLIVEGGRA